MNFLITHGPCLDGETCALFLKQWADEQKETLQTVFCFAGQLSVDLIKRKMPENTCRIFICDLTVNQETLEYLNNLNKEVWIIDHHRSSSIIIKNFPMFLKKLLIFIEIVVRRGLFGKNFDRILKQSLQFFGEFSLNFFNISTNKTEVFITVLI